MKFTIILKRTWIIEWSNREQAWTAIPPLLDAAYPFHFQYRVEAVEWVEDQGDVWMDRWQTNRNVAKGYHASKRDQWEQSKQLRRLHA